MNSKKKLFMNLKGVSYNYRNNYSNVEIFKNLNLSIYSGEMIALLGPSGSGKTTLLNCIGLLDKFTDGYFQLFDKDFSVLSDKEINRIRLEKIGFIFQNHRLFPEFSALENILIPSLINNMDINIAKKKSKEILQFLKLSHRLDHRPAKLSGGEAQRVAIGRALANSPRIILADEPTGNLDKENSMLIFNILKKIINDTKMSCVIATHNNYLAQKMDKTYIIENKNIKLINS